MKIFSLIYTTIDTSKYVYTDSILANASVNLDFLRLTRRSSFQR